MGIEDIIKIIGAFVLAVLSIIPPMTLGAKLATGDGDDTVFLLALLPTVGEVIAIIYLLLKTVM